jgi:hypothetical protein
VAAAGALALAGCATDPWYDNYGYAPYGYGGLAYGGYYGYDYYGPGYGYPGYYPDRRDHWRDHRRDWRDRRDSTVPQGPGVDYTNEYERQNFENRERLLRGQQPSGAGG